MIVTVIDTTSWILFGIALILLLLLRVVTDVVEGKTLTALPLWQYARACIPGLLCVRNKAINNDLNKRRR